MQARVAYQRSSFCTLGVARWLAQEVDFDADRRSGFRQPAGAGHSHRSGMPSVPGGLSTQQLREVLAPARAVLRYAGFNTEAAIQRHSAERVIGLARIAARRNSPTSIAPVQQGFSHGRAQ
jgi:hypothetical protein